MDHTLTCENPWFTKLKNGEKRVEGRKGSEKNNAIQAGDRILFNSPDAQDSFWVQVEKVERYLSLDEYLNAVTLKEALPGVSTVEAGKAIYHQWSSPEEIAEKGFLAIWVKVV